MFFFLYFCSLKLKPKEEQRLKRTQNKQSFQEKQSINNEILPPKEDSASQTQQKGSSSIKTEPVCYVSVTRDGSL